jgi:hypothetical protein
LVGQGDPAGAGGIALDLRHEQPRPPPLVRKGTVSGDARPTLRLGKVKCVSLTLLCDPSMDPSMQNHCRECSIGPLDFQKRFL